MPAPRLTRETMLEMVSASLLLWRPYSRWKDFSCVMAAADPSSQPVFSRQRGGHIVVRENSPLGQPARANVQTARKRWRLKIPRGEALMASRYLARGDLLIRDIVRQDSCENG